jgi:hypothetical protein
MDASVSQTKQFIHKANTLVYIFEEQFQCAQSNNQQEKIDAFATCMVSLTQLFELFNDSHCRNILNSHIDNDKFVIQSIRNLNAISALFVPKFIRFSLSMQHDSDIQLIAHHMKTQADLFSIHFDSL